MELSNRLYAKVISTVDESVMSTNAELDERGPHIFYVNRAFEMITGYTFEEVKHNNPRLLQGTDTDRAEMDRLRKALEAGEIFQGRMTNYRKDATPFRLECWTGPFFSASGKQDFYMAIQRDVTEKQARLKRSTQLELLQKVSHGVAIGGLDLDLVRQKVADVATEVTSSDAAVVEEPDGDK